MDCRDVGGDLRATKASRCLQDKPEFGQSKLPVWVLFVGLRQRKQRFCCWQTAWDEPLRPRQTYTALISMALGSLNGSD
jgi:hypothetical protein